jgi:hypothetical protein
VKLLAAWEKAEVNAREQAVVRRPLLRLLHSESNPDRLDGFLRLERLIWEC